MKSLLSREAAQMFRGGRIFRIHPAHALEVLRIALQDIREIAVIPTVMNNLDDHSARNTIGFHKRDQHLRCRIFRRGIRAGGERIAGIVLPDVDVRIDDQRLCRRAAKSGCECAGKTGK